MEQKKVDPESSAAAKALGSRGGKARAEALTPEERSKIAAKGAKTRWKGHKKKGRKAVQAREEKRKRQPAE